MISWCQQILIVNNRLSNSYILHVIVIPSDSKLQQISTRYTIFNLPSPQLLDLNQSFFHVFLLTLNSTTERPQYSLLDKTFTLWCPFFLGCISTFEHPYRWSLPNYIFISNFRYANLCKTKIHNVKPALCLVCDYQFR